MSSTETPLEIALADAGTLKGLSPKESELVRKAGERVFELSRRLAEREREIDRLQLELTHLRRLHQETEQSRDILSNQVQALQMEADRNFEERSELRRLLASLQTQLQELLTSVLSDPSRGLGAESRLPAGRTAPQRGGAEVTGPRKPAQRRLSPPRRPDSLSRTLRGLLGRG